MFPPFWGFPPAANAMVEQAQRELERMQDRFDAVFKALLDPDPLAVGQTPAEVVAAEGKLRLLRYRPVVERPHPVPLLIVPSAINRSSMLDLLPGRSLVEHLLGQGLDVYMLDWGLPGSEDRLVTFDQYISGYLQRAVRRVRSISGAERVSLLGYSIGGTFAAIFSALHGRLVRNLVLLAAPINFHDEGLLSQWTRKERFNVDLVIDTLGAMPVELMRASFRMLKPTVQIAQSIALAEKLGDVQAVQDLLALQSWLSDTFPLPAEAYRTYLKECYQENHLVQGKLVIDRQRVDLGRIACPLLTITASRDRICPPQSAAVINDLVASADKQVLELPGGHIGIVVGRAASAEMWPKLAEWLVQRSAARPPEAERPPQPPRGAPEIDEALRAGVEVAQWAEEAIVEVTSPLEAVEQAQRQPPAPAPPEAPAAEGRKPRRARRKPTADQGPATSDDRPATTEHRPVGDGEA